MAVSSPLRVLHVYSGNLYGGIETTLRALAEERDKCPEMQPEFALCFEGRIAEEIRSSGAPLHMLGAVRLSRPWSAMRARRNLAKALRARRPDVVVCHAAWPYAIFASVVRAAKTRLVFHRHDIGRSGDWINIFAGRVKPDVVIANSSYTAKHAYPKFDDVESRTVYPIVSPSKVEPAEMDRAALRKSLGASPEDVVILQVSRMQAGKGHRLLLEGLSEVSTSLPWKCWMVGGPQRSSELTIETELRGFAVEQSIDGRVQLLGSRSDVKSLMRAADVFCQPNESAESFGIVFVEALSAGLPVLATVEAGGALEIVDESCGRITSATRAGIAKHLGELIANAELRHRLSESARVRAKDFTNASGRLLELCCAVSSDSCETHGRQISAARLAT